MNIMYRKLTLESQRLDFTRTQILIGYMSEAPVFFTYEITLYVHHLYLTIVRS